MHCSVSLRHRFSAAILLVLLLWLATPDLNCQLPGWPWLAARRSNPLGFCRSAITPNPIAKETHSTVQQTTPQLHQLLQRQAEDARARPRPRAPALQPFPCTSPPTAATGGQNSPHPSHQCSQRQQPQSNSPCVPCGALVPSSGL